MNRLQQYLEVVPLPVLVVVPLVVLRLLVTMPNAQSRLDPPSLATVDYVLKGLSKDTGDLRATMGCESKLWDVTEIRQRNGKPRVSGQTAEQETQPHSRFMRVQPRETER